MPSALTDSVCSCRRPSGVAAGVAFIEKGTQTPLCILPFCFSFPSSISTEMSFSGALSYANT